MLFHCSHHKCSDFRQVLSSDLSIAISVYPHVSQAILFNSSTQSFVLQQRVSSSWSSPFVSFFHHLSHQSFITQDMPYLLLLSILMASLQLLKASSCPKFIQHRFLPSITSLINPSPRKTYPIYFFYQS